MSQKNSSALTGISIANVAGIGRTRQARLKEIAEDVTLSPQGKAQESEAARSETDKELAEAKQKYQDGIARLRADYQSTLDGQKPKRSEVDKLRALGMYDSLDNRQIGLLNAEIGETIVKAIRDMSDRNVAALMDPKQLASAMQRAFDSGDQNALSNLGEVARFRGDQDGVSRAQAYVDALKEQNMTPAQKIAKLELERLDLHEALFGQAIEFARKGGKALDLLENRPVETERDQAIDAQIQAIKLGFEKSKHPVGGND
ncbi:MAG: hypothetical protein AB7I96_13470 [Candidatus Dadabacteria bacterium]